MKFKLYRHIIALAFLSIIALRFGRFKGLIIVLIVYLVMNIDTIRGLIRTFKNSDHGKF